MKNLIFIFLILGIVGCASQPIPEPVVITKTEIVYPSFPLFSAPAPVVTEEISMDYPRTDELVVKNIRKCKEVDSADYDEEFWDKCGIRKIDYDSNLYIGLSEAEFKKMQYNLKALDTREEQWSSRLKIINDLIRAWNAKSIKTNQEPP